MNLLPKYRVELVVEKKSHFYDVFDENGNRLFRFAGTTGFLSVINKPLLVPWAKREALASVEQALVNRITEANGAPIILDHATVQAILKEASKRPDKIKDDASAIGTRIHEHIDLIIHGKEPDTVAEDLVPAVQAFRSWWKNSGIELVLGDTKVASLIHKYGGSLDALGRRQGKLILLDWKTGSGIYAEAALQISAYCQAFMETYGLYIQEGIVVRFGKKAPIDFEWREILDLESSLQAFLDAKRLKESLDLGHFKEAV